jgi:hypothetical protein
LNPAKNGISPLSKFKSAFAAGGPIAHRHSSAEGRQVHELLSAAVHFAGGNDGIDLRVVVDVQVEPCPCSEAVENGGAAVMCGGA